MYKVKVHILLKDDVLDPQGKTVSKSLHHMGHESIQDVRIGKYIEIISNETDETKLKAEVKEMCQKVLTNTVIEKFEFSIEKVAS
jgi:phosphoribosylformylglycinamidine synthase